MKFSDLSAPQRCGLTALVVLQLGLLIAAETDIQERPGNEVVGRKLWWRAICLINFIGPLAYFRWGRKRPALDKPEQSPPDTATTA